MEGVDEKRIMKPFQFDETFATVCTKCHCYLCVPSIPTSVTSFFFFFFTLLAFCFINLITLRSQPSG